MDDIQQVRRIWEALALPGIIDVHTHFMPKQVMDKVWRYFGSNGRFGVRWFTSLVYPHKPKMAEWLNQRAAQFAASTPDCLSTATFYPEPGAADYVAAAIDGEAKVFKAHVQSAVTTRTIRCSTGCGVCSKTPANPR